MLSQRSLKLSSFSLHSFFFCLLSISDFYYSVFQHADSCSVSFSLLLISSRVFFTSVTVFFISVWLSFIVFNFSLKKIILVLCIHFSLGLFDHLYNHYLELLGRLPISTLLSYGVLSYLFETCSFVASFYLGCCFYFYVSGRLVMLSDLGEAALCRWHHMCPSNTFCSHHPSDMF